MGQKNYKLFFFLCLSVHLFFCCSLYGKSNFSIDITSSEYTNICISPQSIFIQEINKPSAAEYQIGRITNLRRPFFSFLALLLANFVIVDQPVAQSVSEITTAQVQFQVKSEKSLVSHLDRLLAPLDQETFNILKGGKEESIPGIEGMSYRSYLRMQNNPMFRKNLEKALKIANEIDPVRFQALLRGVNHLAILPIEAQAMAISSLRLTIIGEKHLRGLQKDSSIPIEFGLILGFTHEARHVVNNKKFNTPSLKDLAQEEESGYQETYYWMNALIEWAKKNNQVQYSKEDLTIQKFVLDHISDNDYQGAIARYVTVWNGGEVDIDGLLGVYSVNNTLKNKELFKGEKIEFLDSIKDDDSKSRFFVSFRSDGVDYEVIVEKVGEKDFKTDFDSLIRISQAPEPVIENKPAKNSA